MGFFDLLTLFCFIYSFTLVSTNSLTLSLYFTLINNTHMQKIQECWRCFIVNISELRINYLFRYWTKFEIRCRESAEKFWKAGEFCRNAERVSGRFKRESCRYKRMYIRASKRGFGNDSSRLYVVDISLLHEIFNGSCARQWIFDGGRNAVWKWSVYRFSVSRSKILNEDIARVKNSSVIYAMVRAARVQCIEIIIREWWDEKRPTKGNMDEKTMISLSDKSNQISLVSIYMYIFDDWILIYYHVRFSSYSSIRKNFIKNRIKHKFFY